MCTPTSRIDARGALFPTHARYAQARPHLSWMTYNSVHTDTQRAGGGPGSTGRGPEQEDRGRIRADDVYPECWRSIH